MGGDMMVDYSGCKYYDNEWCRHFNEWCGEVDTLFLSEGELKPNNFVDVEEKQFCNRFNGKGNYEGYFYQIQCRVCSKYYNAPKVLMGRGGISDDMDVGVEFFTCDRCLSGDIDNSVNEWISREVAEITAKLNREGTA